MDHLFILVVFLRVFQGRLLLSQGGNVLLTYLFRCSSLDAIRIVPAIPLIAYLQIYSPSLIKLKQVRFSLSVIQLLFPVFRSLHVLHYLA